MEFSAPASLVTPAGTLTANGSGDWLRFTNLGGLDMPELRVPTENKAQTDGPIAFDGFLGAFVGTIEGYIKASTVSARNGFEDTLKTYLRSILRADGTLKITQAGQSERKLAVRFYQPLQLSQEDGIRHVFQFGLISTEAFWRDSGSGASLGL